MSWLKQLSLLFFISVLSVHFHDYFRVFLILIESVPHLILDHMTDWFGKGAFLEDVALIFALLFTTAFYSSLLLGFYWILHRRLMLHYGMLVFSVWFVVLLVMTIGPRALAL